jgi:hypothetical protein
MIMKLRSLIVTIIALVITATSLSGCIIVPARGYGYYGPHEYHSWGYDRR